MKFVIALFALFVLLNAVVAQAAPHTAEELKAILQTPVALFVLMYLASFASAMQQVRDSKVNGGTATLTGYLAHVPETIGVIVSNALAFALLILTDQLNFAAALGIGYGLNTAVDSLRKGGRSATL